MINNFICVVCNKYKSVGTPREDGRYVCCDCRKKARVRFVDRRKK